MSLTYPVPSHPQISQWRSNFLSIQRQRLEAVYSQLPSQFGTVLSALPLLLHVNRSKLPGFVTHDTPSGILGLTPEPAEMERLQQMAGQEIPSTAVSRRLIGSVYLISNPTALNATASQTLEIRVCTAAPLEEFQLRNLNQKCLRLCEWAEKQKVPLSISVHTPSTLLEAVPALELGALNADEFYCSSTLMAGAPAFWWFIAGDSGLSDEAYWEALLEDEDFLPQDYQQLPAPEHCCASTMLNQSLEMLEQALTNPYPILNRLQMLTQQMAAYPQHQALSQSMREQLQSGSTEPGILDADSAMIRRILATIATGDQRDSPELQRRALYFSTGIELTNMSAGQRKRWRSRLLDDLVNEWGWSAADLHWLDQRQSWSPAQVLKERNQIASFLLTTFSRLKGFIAVHQTAAAEAAALLDEGDDASVSDEPEVRIDQQRLTLLQNRITAQFESSNDKIPDINPGIRHEMAEDKMTLNRRQNLWRLLQGSWNPDQTQDVIYQSESLIRVLVFAHRNGLLSDYSHLAVYPDHALTSIELKALINDIKTIEHPRASESRFSRDPVVTGWHLFVNSGEKPQSELARHGMEKVSDLDDALNFSSNRENLIRSIELFSRNTWGEWRVEYLTGEQIVHEGLMKILNARPSDNPVWAPIEVHCHSQMRRVVIKKRIESLLADITGHFSHPGSPPYLFQTGRFHLLESRLGQIISHDADNYAHLMKILAQPRRQFRRWQLDSYALQGTPLRYILEKAPGEHWQLWFWRSQGKVELFIMDDRGSLIGEEHTTSKVKDLLLARLSQMNTLNQRFADAEQREPWPLLLAELEQNPETQAFTHVRRKIPQEAWSMPAQGLSAGVDTERQLTLSASGQIFRQTELGNRLFQELSSLLASDEHPLPPFLRDIRVEGNRQLITHMQYTRRIEHYISASAPRPAPPAPAADITSVTAQSGR